MGQTGSGFALCLPLFGGFIVRAFLALRDQILEIFLLVQDEILAFLRDQGGRLDDFLAVFVRVITSGYAQTKDQ